MEIADFIHLNDESDPPILSLIHVKGAGDDSDERGLSVSKYEVVTGQAVKNLRFLDRLIVEKALEEGIEKQVGKLVWHNRRKSKRHDAIRALSQIGADWERRVVILQPHITKSRYEYCRHHPKYRDTVRLKQLDTLLLSAEASARGAGGTILVIGDGGR